MIRADRQRLEAWFRAERIAYIELRSAARAVLPDGPIPSIAGPTPFHFVLYGKINLLLWWGKGRPVTLRLMRRWQELFGAGFIACFGQFADDADTPRFEGLDGEPLNVLAILGREPVGKATPVPAIPVHPAEDSSEIVAREPARASANNSPMLFPELLRPGDGERG